MSRPPRPAVRIGALAPLSPPGWVEPGRHLLAGIEQAVSDVDAAGGVGGRPLELVVRDTAADPARAVAAVDELADLGAVAVVGEFHSVVARAAAARADAVGLPFLCSSAVLDDLTDHPTDRVARLPPPQSRGWRVYADALLAQGRGRVVVATQPSVYWAAGTAVLREHLEARGGAVLDLDVGTRTPADVCDALVDHRGTALLLLVGTPEPATSLVRAVRRDPRLTGVLLGTPAGQAESAAWVRELGDDGAGIPLLRYLPERLTPLGARVRAALRDRLGEEPSFVALEGYDAVAVVADLLRTHGVDRDRLAGAWSTVALEGTRGTIRFTRAPGARVWQWAGAPVQVADRDPARPAAWRVLHADGRVADGSLAMRE